MPTILNSLGPSVSAKLSRRFKQLDAELWAARGLEIELLELSDVQLRQRFESLRKKVVEHHLDPLEFPDLIVQASAIGASAISRIMSFRLHDVQVKGAIATASGAIIEMQTGEGKTMVCALAAIIRAAFDSAVHVATTNAYLAERDHETVQPIFELLGIKSAFVGPDTPPKIAHQAYRCSIVYAPGYTFGFDYLRDQLTMRDHEELVLGRDVLQAINGDDLDERLLQTSFDTIIVDEADSVLIDESTTPLLLSGSANASEVSLEAYKKALESAGKLEAETHFEVEPVKKLVNLTDQGLDVIHQHLREFGKMNLVQPWPKYIQNAIYAQQFLVRDEDYVVDDGMIKLVDQNTGRIFDDRSLRAGLHQALEAKEGLEINPPNTTLARVTRQRFFQLYKSVCGMTGTANGCEEELEHFYNSTVIALPPNQKNKRIELPDRYFDSWESKLTAIVADVQSRLPDGQPILIGTRTIRESLAVKEAFTQLNIFCQILNGVQDREEAEIVSHAGHSGSISIATNMAGRGTDIKLGEKAKASGGLHVIGTQRHESRRVDRQLAGRSARQGDPGSCQFFIAADDPLLEEHGQALAQRIIGSVGNDGESSKDYSAEIIAIQTAIEKRGFEQRRKLVLQDNWMDRVRETMVGHGLP